MQGSDRPSLVLVDVQLTGCELKRLLERLEIGGMPEVYNVGVVMRSIFDMTMVCLICL